VIYLYVLTVQLGGGDEPIAIARKLRAQPRQSVKPGTASSTTRDRPIGQALRRAAKPLRVRSRTNTSGSHVMDAR
jgi:hypothetical protein